jgi:peptidoglycan/xylan/chitin deacetylase (PgdA/CDA1 family)
MRYLVAVLCCLAGGMSAAVAQSESPRVAAAPAQPIVLRPTISADVPAATIIEPTATRAPEQRTEEVQKSVEQAAAKLVKTEATKLAVPLAAELPEQWAEKVQKSVEQAAAKLAKVEAAKADKSSSGKAPEKAQKPVRQAVAIPTARPADAPDAEPAGQSKKVAKAVDGVAQTCPGHPDAIGTSRTITISPSDYRLIGTIQYKHTLPLKDHEVVLTFDDGPIPPYSNAILDTLESQCVKATYFMVGEMARNYPYMVRRIYNAGNSIGTHTQHHPFAMQRLSAARVEKEVDGGIASVEAAIGNPKAVSPFFRIPGLGRTNAIESFLERQKLSTWSADVDTDDWWRGTTPKAIVDRAMKRLNGKGRGIILMHDIHPASALALPLLLKELKAHGYRVVHVVAAGDRPKSVPEIVVAHQKEKPAWPSVMREKMAHQHTGKHRHAKAARHHHIKKHTVKRAKGKPDLAAGDTAKGSFAAASDWHWRIGQN